MDDSILAKLFISRVERSHQQEILMSPRIFVGLLTRGVSGSVLRPIIQHIPKGIVVRALGSDQEHFSKLYRRKYLSHSQTESLNDLTKLWAELLKFFNSDHQMVNEWVTQQLPALEGATPSEFIGSQEGRGVLRQYLEMMKYGDFIL